MKPCTASFGSLTYAIKAQKELAKVGVDAKIVKLDASLSRRGCSYGVSFSCADRRAVKATLDHAKLPATGYHNGGGELI